MVCGMKKHQNAKADKPGNARSWRNIQIPNRVAAAMILAVVALAALALFLKGRGDSAIPVDAPPPQLSQQPDPEAGEVEVLPYTVRSFGGENIKNPFASETLGELRITGIVSSTGGKATAIIEAGGVSYVLSAGEAVPDSSWSIADITSGGVTFSNGSTQKTVYLQDKVSGAGVN